MIIPRLSQRGRAWLLALAFSLSCWAGVIEIAAGLQ